MTEEVYSGSAFDVTQFHGGASRGICLQITTPEGNWVSLSLGSAEVLRAVLAENLPRIRARLEPFPMSTPFLIVSRDGARRHYFATAEALETWLKDHPSAV